MDWKIPNKRHFKIIQILRSIMQYGIDIIWTARYEGPPDYVKDGTQKIRAQKDVVFYSDFTIHMERRQNGGQNYYTSHWEKMGSLESPTESVDRINYITIQKMNAEAKAKQEGTLSTEVEAVVVA